MFICYQMCRNMCIEIKRAPNMTICDPFMVNQTVDSILVVVYINI